MPDPNTPAVKRPGLSPHATPDEVAAYEQRNQWLDADPDRRARLLNSYLGRAVRNQKAEQAAAAQSAAENGTRNT